MSLRNSKFPLAITLCLSSILMVSANSVPFFGVSNVGFTYSTANALGSSVPVTVFWSDNTDGETGFNISAFYQGGQPVTVNNVPVSGSAPLNATSFKFASASGSVNIPATTTPIYFTVNAYYSSVASGGVDSPAIPLAIVSQTPSGFATRYVVESGVPKIRVSWKDGVNELGYTITRNEINAQGQSSTTYIIVPKDTTQYLDSAIERGFTYKYSMTFFNGSGTSKPTSLKTVVVPL